MRWAARDMVIGGSWQRMIEPDQIRSLARRGCVDNISQPRRLARTVIRNVSRRAIIGTFTALISVAPRAVAAAEPAGGKAERVALKGYDPVAYFTDGKPEKGSAEFTAAYDDATYWFKNAEHRALFVADPDRFAPQFDGYCAITVSRGGKYEPDPEAWAIADGKLYVFSDKRGMPLFAQQRASIVAQANANWPALRAQP